MQSPRWISFYSFVFQCIFWLKWPCFNNLLRYYIATKSILKIYEYNIYFCAPFITLRTYWNLSCKNYDKFSKKSISYLRQNVSHL
jgi:hypothetical protein